MSRQMCGSAILFPFSDDGLISALGDVQNGRRENVEKLIGHDNFCEARTFKDCHQS